MSNPSPHGSPAPHRHMTRAEARRRRQRRTIRRIAGVTLVLMIAAGGVAYLLPQLTAQSADPSGKDSVSVSAPSGAGTAGQEAPSVPAQDTEPEAENCIPPKEPPAEQPADSSAGTSQPDPGMTAAEAAAILNDPLMILVNHHSAMPENYTFDTKECGSAASINKTLQTVACDAFLQMQAAAAADGVTVWMQSGYRSVSYQATLYKNKTQYYRNQGYDEAAAKEKAAAIVNPPGYSEHNCGLAADLNSPEHTALDEGFENTAAFRWLQEHAGEYGFILRYPKGKEDVTEITYEPWHWRYVGVENAARINASGLCFEEYIARLQTAAAQGQG